MKSVKFAVGMILSALVFTGSVASATDAILINFTSDHCGHCRAMEPALGELARTGVPIRNVNVSNEPAMAQRFGIRTTPTFVVFSDGKEVTRLVGTQTVAALRSAIAIDPSGPLIRTNSVQPSLRDIPTPQTRLAPIGNTTVGNVPVGNANRDTLASTAATRRGEPMPNLTLADAVQRARAATVRLKVHDGQGFGVGTGTIIDVHGEEALVLTCGHLFRETQGKGKVEVELFVGGQTKSVTGNVIDYDADKRDIALVAIRPGFPVQPVQVIGNATRVANGQSAFSFGCDRGADPSRRDTRITGVNKYDQHLGVSNLEIAGAPIDGRSGGGLFDDQGRLIGVCNAADYKGDVGIYAGPGSVHWQLDRVDLAHLYTNSAGTNRIASLPQSGVDAAPSAFVSQPANIQPANIQPAALQLTQPAPISQPAAPPASPIALSSNQEVIVIVRDRERPTETSQVMTLTNPSPQLMQMIQQSR